MKKILFIFTFVLSGYVCIADNITAIKTYRISMPVSGDKSLTVKNSSLNRDADVVIRTETNVNVQKWTLVRDDDSDTYQLLNVYTGKILYRKGAAADGADICQYDLNDLTAGKWEIIPVENQAGLFYIAQMNQAGTQKLCLESLADTDNSLLKLYVKKEGAEAVRQMWKLEEANPDLNYFTPAVRDEMMRKWAGYYYHKAATGYVLGGGGWWGDAEMFEVVLDAFETTGNSEYEEMFRQLYVNFIARNRDDWAYNDYNDDIAWMVLASVRAYLMFGDQNFLTNAKNNFDRMYSRALLPSGMLRWKERDAGSANGTNSCINGPAEVAACYLAVATGDEAYYVKAKNLYALQRKYLYVPSTGQVYDSFLWNGNTPSNYNYWASTYNQGTFLGAAIMLYNHFGDKQYKDDAQMIMKYTIQNLCEENGIIKVCQVATGDLAGFKGILMRYVRRFIVDLCHPEYAEWMQKNAFHAYNNRNSRGISSSAWLTKAPENFIFEDCTENCDFSNDPFGPSTAVSAAFNAPINKKLIIMDAFSKIEAEHFDYLKGVHVKAGSNDDSAVLENIKHGFYTGYNNVDFGDNMAKSIEVRVSRARSIRAKIEIHLDSPEGTLAATISVPSEGDEWQTISCDLEQFIEGKRNIYLVYKAVSSASDIMNVDYFRFKTDSYTYPDITDNGGIISSSHAGEGLPELIDNRLSTKYHAQCDSRDVVILTYRSPVPVTLRGYALGVADDAPEKDPKAWKLQASVNGADWVDMDIRSNQEFDSRCSKKQFDVSAGDAYEWFRLCMTERNGSSDGVQLSEWQLYGGALFENDITADGGMLTAQYTGNEPDETFTKLTDKETSSAYRIDQTDISIEYKANAVYRIESYSITSAENFPESDPKEWELYGSADGKEWTQIDARVNQQFPYRNVTQFYHCSLNEGFRYFRLHITATNGSLTTQIAEWQLLGKYYYDRFHNDITANGGKLTSSQDMEANSGKLKALNDNNGNTVYTLNASELPVWIQYESTTPVQLRAYSLTVADDENKNPRNWTLQGSNDGTQWETVNSRSNIVFNLKGERKDYPVSSSSRYSYFRLNITRLSGDDAKEVKITEWELHGSGLSSQAITNNGGTVEAEYAGNNSSEGINRLIDNSIDKKYCTNFTSSAWIVYQSPAPVKPSAYSITSANDNPVRDPVSWTLEASNDRNNWTLIDAQENQAFPYRFETQYYSCNKEREEFSHFRLNITANNGADMIQMAEWQLLAIEGIGIPDNIGVSAVAISKAAVYPALVNDFFYVDMPEKGEIQIFNISGQLINVVSLEKGISTIQVNNYSKGMYVVRIKFENKFENIKIIKQ